MPKKRIFLRFDLIFLNFFLKLLDFFFRAWYYIKAVAMSGALKKRFFEKI